MEHRLVHLLSPVSASGRKVTWKSWAGQAAGPSGRHSPSPPGLTVQQQWLPGREAAVPSLSPLGTVAG